MWKGAFYALAILAGIVRGQQSSERNIGDTLQLTVVTGTDTDVGCYLETPSGETIELKPENHSNDKYVLLEDELLRLCRAEVRNLDRNDAGVWTLRSVSELGQGTSTKSSSIHLTIIIPDETTNIHEIGNENTTWLTDIEYSVNVGLKIDITLSKIDHEEICLLYNQDKENIDLNSKEIEGVTAQSRSKFVSCRVTIGPMSESFIGTWTLCGKHTIDKEEVMRCQPANIAWRSPHNPNLAWRHFVRSHFNHVVNFGGYLRPEVSDSRNHLITCNIITPYGDDLVITDGSTYPGLRSESTTELCRVAIGPIDQTLLGNWTLYGRFAYRSTINEVRFPMNLALYDETTNIHEIGNENTTWLTDIEYSVNVGLKIDITLSKIDHEETCLLYNQDKENIDLNSKEIEGVTAQSRSKFVSCRVTIGPMSESFIGTWTLCGKHTIDKEEVMRCQPANIAWRSPHNPNLAWRHFVRSHFNHVVNFGGYLRPEVSDSRNHLITCNIITPYGDDLVITDGSTYPGLRSESTRELCRLAIGPIDQTLLGNWTLYGRFAYRSTINEVRFPMTLALYDETTNIHEIGNENTTWLTDIEYSVNVGLKIDITLSKIDHEETCLLYNQDKENIDLNSKEIEGVTAQSRSKFVSCRVTIGPMNESFIGTWTLCGKHIIDKEEVMRCQPANIAWRSPHNPNLAWRHFVRSHFNHVVNFGGYLRPVVSDSRNHLITCNIITPYGDDLVITDGSTYPGLRSESTRELCRVAIGSIDQTLLGNWTLYGRFAYRSTINEVRFPMTLALYDEENPYAQPYNVTELNSIDNIVNLGNTIQIRVTSTGVVDTCIFEDPSGQIYEKGLITPDAVIFIDAGTSIACILSIGPITESMLGDWQLIGKFSNNNMYTELRQKFKIIKEDPANPIQDKNRLISWLDEQYFNTDFGQSHTVNIVGSRTTVESCHVRTPEGLQYIIMEGFNIPGIEVVDNSNVLCGIKVNVISEDVIGDWMLISRENSMNLGSIERRLNFTIHIEKYVTAFPNNIKIGKGNNMRIRLENPTDKYESCILLDPSGHECNHCVKDENNIETCGYIVFNIQEEGDGKWEITYGQKVVYRSLINVVVTDYWEKENSVLTWIKDRPIKEVLGPENLVYCKVEDPSGYLFFDGFGRCNISIEKVSSKHAGVWTIHVGLQGRILTEEFTFSVIVAEAEPKPIVTTYVAKEQPSVILSCSVPSQYKVRTCKFREPSGQVLFAERGVEEDRYKYHDNQVSFQSNVTAHECGLRITNPIVQDLGLWRCALETEVETYYGFLTVLCPWALQNPEVADSVVSVPTLTASRNVISTVEGESVTLSCNVQSPIRYCYFRSRNGTVFNVGSETFEDGIEYVGAGLDAGECGIKFNNLMVTDSGGWSCHVGFPNSSEPEQRVEINVTVQALMIANQYNRNNILVVEGNVYNQRQLEYCRFVRIDGTGFTSENLPEGYTSQSVLSNGHCSLVVTNPNILDHHPWTVVARILGQSEEIALSTDHTLGSPDPGIDGGSDGESDGNIIIVKGSRLSIFSILIALICVVMLIVMVLTIPSKNRERTVRRFSEWRENLYFSFRKRPIQEFSTMNDANNYERKEPLPTLKK